MASRQFPTVADHLDFPIHERTGNLMLKSRSTANRDAAPSIGLERVLDAKRKPGLFP